MLVIKFNNDKLKKLNLNSDNFYVLADFDNTITAKECNSSMGIITKSKMFEDGFEEEHSQICNKYKTKALESTDYNIKNEIWIKTLTGYFELLRKYELTQELLKKMVRKSNIRFRDGMLNFLGFLYKEQIPVVIISAGVTNSIEIF